MRLVSPRLWLIALAAIGLGLTAQPAKAGFTNGIATAFFNYDGNQTLTLTLTNTSGSAVTQNGNVLQGLFFNYSGSGFILSADTAMVAATSTVINYANPNIKNVSGEWAYNTDVASHNYGIASAGLNLFGPGDTFGGASPITSNSPPDGPAWGIVSLSTQTGQPTGGGPGDEAFPMIRNEVIFSFTVTSGFDITKVGNVAFQYGTALNLSNGTPDGGGGGGPHDVTTPAPAGLVLFATALPVLALRRVLRRKPVVA
jgi:hypothetical protein